MNIIFIKNEVIAQSSCYTIFDDETEIGAIEGYLGRSGELTTVLKIIPEYQKKELVFVLLKKYLMK